MKNIEFTALGLTPGGRFAGRYDVVRKLGAGGMAVVFEVRDAALNNDPMALKVFSPSEDSDDNSLIHRFRNEVVITRKLTHPNIVRTYDFGELENGIAYMTMEYVDGYTLDQLVRTSLDGHLDIEYAARIILEIAEAIDYAHQHGVIHRDLKPGNVLISRDGEVKVTDFGLAQALGCHERLTMTGECVGTPAYMSPEQVLGKPADQRSDLYALGMIAFELVTGKLPFAKKGWFELANQIVNEPIPDMVINDELVPEWYDSLVHKATAKDPETRFQSAKELIDSARSRTILHSAVPDHIPGLSRFGLEPAAKPGRSPTPQKAQAVLARGEETQKKERRSIQLSVTIPERAPLWLAVTAVFFLLATVGVQSYLGKQQAEDRTAVPFNPLKRPSNGVQSRARPSDGVGENTSDAQESQSASRSNTANPADDAPFAQFMADQIAQARRDGELEKFPLAPWKLRQKWEEKMRLEQTKRKLAETNRRNSEDTPSNIPKGYRVIR